MKRLLWALLVGMTSCAPIDDVSLWPGMSYEDVDRVSAGTGSRLKELIRSYATPIRDVGRFTLVDPRTFAPMLSLEDVKLDPIEFGRAIVHFTVAPSKGADFEDVASQARSAVMQVLAWGWRCKGLEDPTLPFRHPLLWPASDVDPCTAGPDPGFLWLSCPAPAGWLDSAIGVDVWCLRGRLRWVLKGVQRF